MNILYLGFFNDLSSESSGVNKKIITKIKYLNQNNTTCKLVSFAFNIKEPIIVNEYVTILPVTNYVTSRWFNSIKIIQSLCNSALEYLKSNYTKFDTIIFRYPLASNSFLKILKQFPNKLFLEHNTIELSEVIVNSKLYRNQIPFKLKPGYFMHYLVDGFFPVWREKFYKKKILHYAKGGISVTSEIGLDLKKINSNYNYIVATNGIEFKDVEPIKYKPITNQLKIIMLLGNNAPWHGVERIYHSLINYNYTQKIIIDVFGISLEDSLVNKFSFKNNCAELNFKGLLKSSEVKNILCEYNAGVSTMQLYVKGLKEAVSLKTREYLSYGLPVIYAYSDSDINSNNTLKNNCIEFSNSRELIDFKNVVDFLVKLYKNENLHLEIHSASKLTFDYKVKANELISSIKNW